MQQRVSLWLTWLSVSATLTLAGCSTTRVPWSKDAAGTSAVAAPGVEPVSLTYRTSSDRLNVASGLLAGGLQTAAYQPGGWTPFPSVTTSRLRVSYPHPHGTPDMALAEVTFDPQTDGQPSGASALWKKIVGGQDAPVGPLGPQEVWAMEVPKRELDAVLAKLRRENFYERSQVLGATTFLATDVHGVKFGKEYRTVDELDALILRVRQQGRLVQGGPDSMLQPAPSAGR